MSKLIFSETIHFDNLTFENTRISISFQINNYIKSVQKLKNLYFDNRKETTDFSFSSCSVVKEKEGHFPCVPLVKVW